MWHSLVYVCLLASIKATTKNEKKKINSYAICQKTSIPAASNRKLLTLSQSEFYFFTEDGLQHIIISTSQEDLHINKQWGKQFHSKKKDDS